MNPRGQARTLLALNAALSFTRRPRLTDPVDHGAKVTKGQRAQFIIDAFLARLTNERVAEKVISPHVTPSSLICRSGKRRTSLLFLAFVHTGDNSTRFYYAGLCYSCEIAADHWCRRRLEEAESQFWSRGAAAIAKFCYQPRGPPQLVVYIWQNWHKAWNDIFCWCGEDFLFYFQSPRAERGYRLFWFERNS